MSATKASDSPSPERVPDTLVTPPRPWSPSSDATSATSSPEHTSIPALVSHLATLQPSPALDAPITTTRSRKGPNHIPRPANAFILFRQALFRELKQVAFEKDQRLFSQIISATWAELDRNAKAVWYHAAAIEKARHAQMHPHYRFSPVARADRPRKRNVKRNGPQDRERCRALGKLIAAGKRVHELEREARRIDARMRDHDAATTAQSEFGIPPSSEYAAGVFDPSLAESSEAHPRSEPEQPDIPTHPTCSPVKAPFKLLADAVKDEPSPRAPSQPRWAFAEDGDMKDAGSPIALPRLLELPALRLAPEEEARRLLLPFVPGLETHPQLLPAPTPTYAAVPSFTPDPKMPVTDDWAWYDSGAASEPFEYTPIASASASPSPFPACEYVPSASPSSSYSTPTPDLLASFHFNSITAFPVLAAPFFAAPTPAYPPVDLSAFYSQVSAADLGIPEFYCEPPADANAPFPPVQPELCADAFPSSQPELYACACAPWFERECEGGLQGTCQCPGLLG